MANYLIHEVHAAIQDVVTANGGSLVSPSSVRVSSGVRFALERLAVEYGLKDTGDISTKDLVSLYSVARKNIESGATVADRIEARKKAYDPFAGIPAATPVPTPSEPVQAPSGALADWMHDQIKRIDKAIIGNQEILTNRVNSISGDIVAMCNIVERLEASMPSQAKLEAMVSEALKTLAPTSLNISINNQPPVLTGTVHFMTGRIMQVLASGLNVYLHGPAGSGKTTAARKIADTFGLPFYFAAKVESEYLLLGFKDARGETIRTQFREAYEHGGVFLFDEMDASSPSAIVAINAALANGFCPFPDGVIMQHADFKCIGAGNTKLTGANRQYNGRVQMDAASIDRFYFLEFPYDEALELAIAPNRDWCLYVQAVRKAVSERGLQHLVTPRATIAGGIALEAGETWEQVEEGAIFKGLEPDTARQLREATQALKF